ncbi:MAG: hypothetical protein AAF431_14395 [Pseudomonadota bacterium]
MKSLLPIISVSSGNSSVILVNGEKLSRRFGCETLIKVAKTRVHVHPEDWWEFILVDETQRVTLLSSNDVEVNEPTSIDLVDKLGHQVSLAPWQLLCLNGSFDRGAYVTYLADE